MRCQRQRSISHILGSFNRRPLPRHARSAAASPGADSQLQCRRPMRLAGGKGGESRLPKKKKESGVRAPDSSAPPGGPLAGAPPVGYGDRPPAGGGYGRPPLASDRPRGSFEPRGYGGDRRDSRSVYSEHSLLRPFPESCHKCGCTCSDHGFRSTFGVAPLLRGAGAVPSVAVLLRIQPKNYQLVRTGRTG